MKRSSLYLAGFAVVSMSTGTAMVIHSLSLSAQVNESLPTDLETIPFQDTTFEEQSIIDATLPAPAPSTNTGDILLPPATQVREPIVGTEDGTNFFDSSMEVSSAPGEQATPQETNTLTPEGTPDNTTDTPFGGKTFYRAGKEAPVVPTAQSSSAEVNVPSSAASSTESSESSGAEVLSDTESGSGDVLLPSAPENTEQQEPTSPDTSQGFGSLFSLLTQSTYLFSGVAVLIGGVLYLLVGRKKKAVKVDTAPAPTSPTTEKPAATVEESSPRLEQALKAMEREGISIPKPPESLPPIPQEGNGPSAPQSGNPV